MSFYDLPVELGHAIVQLVIPHDFESFALVCKSTYQLLKRYIQEHNKLRRQYQCFKYPPRNERNEDSKEQPISSLQLILEISKTPVIAKYIKSADFRCDNGDNYMWVGNLPEVCSKTVQDINKGIEHDGGIERLLNESIYLKEAGQDPEDWFQGMLSDNGKIKKELYSSVFLLTLLPNVREIAFPAHWSDIVCSQDQLAMKPLFAVMDCISKRANDDSILDAALSKLITIDSSELFSYYDRNDLDPMDLLLAIKSVRNFIARRFAQLFDTPLPLLPLHRSYPGLEYISFDTTFAGEDRIGEFLSRAPNLKSFHLDHYTTCDSFEYDWDAGMILDDVELSVGKTLEKLYITEVKPSTKTYPKSLKGFERLKRLKLNVGIFLKTPYEYGVDYYGKKEEEEEAPCEDLKIPHLGDFLPPSISVVELNGESNPRQIRCLRRLFEDFKEERPFKLPRLRRIKVSCQNVKGHEEELPPLFEFLSAEGVECKDWWKPERCLSHIL